MSAKWVSVLVYLFPAVISLAPDVAEARECIDYGDYVHWVGGVDTPGYARGVAVSGSYAYVADGESGLQILPAQCDVVSIDDVGTGTPSLPQAFRLSQNYPNPFNPSTTVE